MSEHNAFLIVPALVANHPEIDDSTAIFFGRLNALSNQNGHCYASDKYLSEICKCGDRVITDRLKKLRDLGFIRINSKKNGLRWERKIWTLNNYSYMTEDEIQKSFTKGISVPHREASACPIEGHGRAPEKNKREKNKKENLPPSPPKEEEEDFSSKSKKEEVSRPKIVQKVIDKWVAEGRPQHVIDATVKAYFERPLGSVKSVSSWLETVYAQKFESADADELFEIRRKFAEKLENQSCSNYYFAKDKDILCYTSGQTSKEFDIKGTRKGSEEFWVKHKLGKQGFVEWKIEQRSANGTCRV